MFSGILSPDVLLQQGQVQLWQEVSTFEVDGSPVSTTLPCSSTHFSSDLPVSPTYNSHYESKYWR